MKAADRSVGEKLYTLLKQANGLYDLNFKQRKKLKSCKKKEELNAWFISNKFNIVAEHEHVEDYVQKVISEAASKSGREKANNWIFSLQGLLDLFT